MTINLPFNLTADMELDDAIMAIQRNFDHLSGKLGGVSGQLFAFEGVLGSQSEEMAEAINNFEVDWGAFAEGVGSIRFAVDEAQLAEWEDNGEVQDGDAAYIEGVAGLYSYQTTQPTVTTYDSAGDPVNTPVTPVAGTDNWYRTIDGADLLADSITATHIRVETLDGITINGLNINGGTITGVQIIGSTITQDNPIADLTLAGGELIWDTGTVEWGGLKVDEFGLPPNETRIMRMWAGDLAGDHTRIDIINNEGIFQSEVAVTADTLSLFPMGTVVTIELGGSGGPGQFLWWSRSTGPPTPPPDSVYFFLFDDGVGNPQLRVRMPDGSTGRITLTAV